MNIHERIDRIGRWSPKTKVITAFIIVAVLAAIASLLVLAGYRWAKSNAEAERTAQDDRIAVYEANAKRALENETQLAAQNSILRKQNEVMAEALKTADTKREQQAAAQMAERNTALANRLNDIDADKDHDQIVCGICIEAKASGFPLSAEFCNRCEEKR